MVALKDSKSSSMPAAICPQMQPLARRCGQRRGGCVSAARPAYASPIATAETQVRVEHMGHDESRCIQQCSLEVRLGTVAPAELCIERPLESFP